MNKVMEKVRLFAGKALSQRGARSFLALLLAAAFVFAAVPASFPLLAESGDYTERAPLDDGAPTKAEGGTSDVKWHLSSSGVLTLQVWDSRTSPTGFNNRSYFAKNDWPWHEKGLTNQIKSVVFKFNANNIPISYIGQYKTNSMFRECVNLESVTIETKEIGGVTVPALDITNCRGLAHMFRDCTKLKSVDLSMLSATSNIMEDISYMFEGCTSLESVKLPSELNFKDDTSTKLENRFPGVSGMFENCTSLTAINNLAGLDVSNVKNMQQMFYGCSSLTRLDLSSFGHLESVQTMRDFVGNCTSLDTLILDNMDNSAIGPSNNRHSVYDSPVSGDSDGNSYGVLQSGASEFDRDLGLKTCPKLRVLSANNSKVWMCPNNRGIAGNEYYKAANDVEILWWWTATANDKVGDSGTQLRFTSSVNPTVSNYMLNKRDYVDLITDRDGGTETTHGYTTDGVNSSALTALPDGETNINIKYGDLNPHGAGFLAPGVYETGEADPNTGFLAIRIDPKTGNPVIVKFNTWSDEHAPIEYTDYRISYIGSVPYHVSVNGTPIGAGVTKIGDFVFNSQEHDYDGMVTSFNTVNKTKAVWDAMADANNNIVYDNCNIVIRYEKAAVDKAGVKHDVEIQISKITFKNVDKIEADPGRGHDGNRYYDTVDAVLDHTNGEYYNGMYYRTVLRATESDGITFSNAVRGGDPANLNYPHSANVISGGSGTDIEFSIKILDSVDDSGKPATVADGSHFIFYSGDLDVTSFQNWKKPVWSDQCFDYLPAADAVYGVGGESFIIRNNNDSIWFAPHTGLRLESTAVEEGAPGAKATVNYRTIVSTGSDPDTPFSEFTVRSDAKQGGHYTWVSGTSCETHALRNTPQLAKGEEYVVYDFSNSIGHVPNTPAPTNTPDPSNTPDPTNTPAAITLAGNFERIVTVVEENLTGEHAFINPPTERTVDNITFRIDPADNKKLQIEVRGIVNKPVSVTALLKYDVSAVTNAAEYEWRTITLIPATNVHYEEGYLTYTDGKDKDGEEYAEWGDTGTPINPVYDAESGQMIGSGTDRQSDANTLYGYDATYAEQTGDSNGRSKHIELGQSAFDAVKAGGKWPTASFTFTGTGFDIIGRIGVNTGVYSVSVLNTQTNEYVVSQLVRTRYFGENYQDGADPMLYQVPIIHIDSYKDKVTKEVKDLPYGTYKVDVRFVWMPALAYLPSGDDYNPNMKGAFKIPGIPELDYEVIDLFPNGQEPTRETYPNFDIYVDAIRIYNPAGTNLDTQSTDPVKSAIAKAYDAAKELNPDYRELRKLILSAEDLTGDGAANGIFAIEISPHMVPKPKYVQATDPDTGEPLYEMVPEPKYVQATDPETGELLYEMVTKPKYVQATDPDTGELLFDRFGNPVYVQATDPETDEPLFDKFGEPVYVQATDPDTGEPLYETVPKPVYVQATDPETGERLFDRFGKPVYVQATDPETGELLYEMVPKPVYVQATDPETGELLFDRFGNPVYVQATHPKTGDLLYETDAEGNPVYMEVLPRDGYNMSNVAYYEAYGPNNEVYLKTGQGFAFKLEGPAAKMHISAKAPYGSTAFKVTVLQNGTVLDSKEQTVVAATELYYDFSDLLPSNFNGGDVYVVVQGLSDNIVSLCQLKTVGAASGVNPNVVADRDSFELGAAVIGDMRGDVNGDCAVNVEDALLVMRASLAAGTLTPYGSYCADYDRDGDVDVADALAIMRTALAE